MEPDVSVPVPEELLAHPDTGEAKTDPVVLEALKGGLPADGREANEPEPFRSHTVPSQTEPSTGAEGVTDAPIPWTSLDQF